jgi:nicotinamide phosphoribosyltransferase
MLNNIILNTDSYKASHFLQYPSGAEYVSSYIESRGGDYSHLLFFGLQAFIKEYLLQPFTQQDIDDADEVLSVHGLPFNREGWEYILRQHSGFLPLSIEAVPEGTVIQTRNVLVQVVNTDPNCFWLTSYIETALLRAIWYPTTVATTSWHVKQAIKANLDETADNLDGLLFKLHDFGARGASSQESAALGGMAHLINFQGTDTLSGLLAAKQYYREPMAGYSIPAAEHSTVTAWGREHEHDAFANMLKQFSGQGKLLAVVSDSYDIWYAIDEIWGKQLKQKVIESGGTVVVRPDSGEPVAVVCLALEKLMSQFGFSTNSKGYKVLPNYIRLIQGDGLSPQVITDILNALQAKGISGDNVAFGMGGALLQKCDRDTLKFAMKASAIRVDGNWRDIYKDPITAPVKKSKRGRLALIKNINNDFETIRLTDLGSRENHLMEVFRNGQLLKDTDFSDVRLAAQSVSLTAALTQA